MPFRTVPHSCTNVLLPLSLSFWCGVGRDSLRIRRYSAIQPSYELWCNGVPGEHFTKADKSLLSKYSPGPKASFIRLLPVFLRICVCIIVIKLVMCSTLTYDGGERNKGDIRMKDEYYVILYYSRRVFWGRKMIIRSFKKKRECFWFIL